MKMGYNLYNDEWSSNNWAKVGNFFEIYMIRKLLILCMCSYYCFEFNQIKRIKLGRTREKCTEVVKSGEKCPKVVVKSCKRSPQKQKSCEK